MRGAGTGSLILLAAGLALSRAPAPTRAADKDPDKEAFDRQVRPVLAKYCSGCHGEKKQSGKLNLAPLSAEVVPQKWQHVWERLRSRQMPPADQPQPTADERVRLLDWIEAQLKSYGCADVERLTNRADAPVHHVRGRDDVRAGLLVHLCPAQGLVEPQGRARIKVVDRDSQSEMWASQAMSLSRALTSAFSPASAWRRVRSPFTS